VPVRLSGCSSISSEVQREHDACRGNDTEPQAPHRPPMRRGSSDGHVNRPRAIGAGVVARSVTASPPPPTQHQDLHIVNQFIMMIFTIDAMPGVR
jgi:hypothetical protein